MLLLLKHNYYAVTKQKVLREDVCACCRGQKVCLLLCDSACM